MSLQLRGAGALLSGVSFVALTLAGAGAGHAQSATPLPEIAVTSDKVEGTTYDSPSTVSVHTDKDIDRQNIHSPADLVRDEPGVSVGNQPARGGQTNYVIRGIGENRVRLEIDGIKIPDFPGSNIGAGTYTRDFVDFDSLKRVEIIRGPGSALYGSDAIGGVVSYITKDPADYLRQVNKDWFVSQKLGFDSADRSMYGTSTAAWRAGRWESMLLYTYRYGHEYRPNIQTNRVANPQDSRTDNILAKSVYHSENMGDFKFTGEFMRKTVDTNLFTETIAPVTSSLGKDVTERPRFSFDWSLPLHLALADHVNTKLYWTKMKREEFTDQTRIGPARFRHSDFVFDQDISGTEIQWSAKRDWLGWNNHITYGVAGDITTSSRPRERYETTFPAGTTTNTFAGDVYPNKNFPDTTTTNGGAYIQDIMQRGALRIIPAVRFDYYHLEPHPDAKFLNSNQGGFVVNPQTETAVSPKFGATYDLTENYRVFGQYAHGFRAPPYDNANFGFQNTLQGYQILPNANLKPETSDGFEGGLRGRFVNGSSFQASAFYNRYEDFIDTVTLSSPPATPLINFQYQNIANVVIYGYEFKGEWKFRPDWSVFGSLAWAYGTNQVNDQPLNSVDPLTAIGGLRYQNYGWTAEGRVRYYDAKERVSDATIFRVPSHTVVDTLFSYEVSPRYTINFGIYNLFDLAYFDPQAVAGLPTTTATMELYRAAGRTAFLNTIVRW